MELAFVRLRRVEDEILHAERRVRRKHDNLLLVEAQDDTALRAG